VAVACGAVKETAHASRNCSKVKDRLPRDILGKPGSPVEEDPVNLGISRSFFFANMLRWWSLAAAAFIIPAWVAADSITEWNERALACTITAKQAPYPAARALAIVHVAMFDAANSIEHRYSAYKMQASASPGSSAEAAAVAAAHSALLKLFPDQSADLDVAYAASMARVPDDGKAGGVTVGEKVAADIISLRENDGAEAPNQYRPVTAPGVYVMTILPVGSTWSGVKPWLMKSSSQFRPGPPPGLTSQVWTRDYNEIKAVGNKMSTVRTAAQTEIGRFWALVGPASWDPIVRQLAATPGRTLLENARLFALTEMAAADSQIAVFDAKYTYNFWRPITAIRNGDLDGNDQTDRVPDWEPLIDTPLHPEYPCAHCINSMAVATVLKSEYGDRQIPVLTMTSPTAPGVVHTWSSIKEWTDEVADARIYAGLHYRSSTLVGQEMGRKIGELAVSSYLRPVP
jgi:hypothetical protein